MLIYYKYKIIAQNSEIAEIMDLGTRPGDKNAY
jgi:hypothetical protein